MTNASLPTSAPDVVTRAPAAAAKSLRPPSMGQSQRTGRIVWDYLISIVVVHLLASLALLPWLFSWTGVVLLVAGTYFFGCVGINLCYHRLLAHRSFSCPFWLEKFFVIVALCCFQDAPARWVAAHRIHHNHADDEPDPHSPLVSFLWSHVGWMLVDNHGLNKISNYERYVRDMLRQPFYLTLERGFVPIGVYLAHAVLFFAVAFGVGCWIGPSEASLAADADASRWMAGLQLGLSVLVWGVFLRTVVVWHITWSVNSLTHMFGYRNYDTDEESRNNWFVAILTSGEGWHNNHHADPAAASNRRRWWEFDLIYGVIRGLELLGLAKNVVRPRQQRSKVSAADAPAKH